MTAGRLTKLFKGNLPSHTKHARLGITYLVQGTPVPRKEIPNLEPNVIVEIRYAPSRPYTQKATVSKG